MSRQFAFTPVALTKAAFMLSSFLICASSSAGVRTSGSTPIVVSLSCTVGRLHGLHRLAVKLIDDVTGRLRGNKCRPPDGVFGIGKAGFRGVGDIRQSGSTFWAVYRKGGELALANMGQHNTDRQKREIDPPAHHLGYCFRATFEGNVNGFETPTQTEALRTQVRIGPNTRRGESERSRFGLGGRNKFVNGLNASRR